MQSVCCYQHECSCRLHAGVLQRHLKNKTTAIIEKDDKCSHELAVSFSTSRTVVEMYESSFLCSMFSVFF
jgi:hypothetical protein